MISVKTMSAMQKDAEGPLAEFAALRQEIERRNVVQHALFVLQLTSAGTIFSLGISSRTHSAFLLILPVSTYMLCARYVDQQLGIQRAARYIKNELSHHVPGGLGWESWQVQHPAFVRASTIRRIDSLLIMFPGIGAAALVWTANTALTPKVLKYSLPERIGFDAIWFIGAIAVLVCVQMIWSMLRHPLGDTSLPSLYRLPPGFERTASSDRLLLRETKNPK